MTGIAKEISAHVERAFCCFGAAFGCQLALAAAGLRLDEAHTWALIVGLFVALYFFVSALHAGRK